jgi:hypothetical protein
VLVSWLAWCSGGVSMTKLEHAIAAEHRRDYMRNLGWERIDSEEPGCMISNGEIWRKDLAT